MKYKIYDYIEVDNAGLKEDDDVIVLSPISERVIIINYTAWEVLDMIKKEYTTAEICNTLKEKYDADLIEIEQGVDSIIQNLQSENIIYQE